ncbi:hypothetical protein ACQEVF_00540 [Nonomuraea polychroma]
MLTRPLGELPATSIKCLLDGEKPTEDVARRQAHLSRFHEAGEVLANA